MWIVRIALERPYTFIVCALLILILSPVIILRTPTDIFPNIDIPVIAAAFNYTGLNAEEVEERITSIYERVLTTTVGDIEHIESQFHRRPRHHQDLLPAHRQHQRRHRPGDGGLAAGAAPASAGHHRAVSAGLQRFERAHSAARAGRQGALRAAAVRLRRELHPHPAGHHPRLRHSVPLRRQAAPDHGGPGPGGHAVAKAFPRPTW